MDTFVDLARFNLKAGLLLIGNIHPSIPTAHFVYKKETYENTDLLLKAISYGKCGRKICGDLKVIGLFLAMHSGHTKFCCFLCEWESRAKDKHYKIKDCPMREKSVRGEKCVRSQPLVDKDKILLPPLHIKSGLMRNFVKAMNKYGTDFECLGKKFSKLSDARLKDGIFIGPQIPEIINDDPFEHLLKETKKSS